MDKMIIGSTAAKKHFPDFREPSNLDFALRYPDHADYHRNRPGVRCLWMPQLWSVRSPGLYASPNMLFTISLSLRPFVDDEKIVKDVKFFKSKGCDVIDVLHELLTKRWQSMYGTVN